MAIYYIMIEAAPNNSNPESKEFGGAYINCWVKASTQKEALKKFDELLEGKQSKKSSFFKKH